MSCEQPCSLCSPDWYRFAGQPTVRQLRDQGPHAFESTGARYRGRKLRLCSGCLQRALPDPLPYFSTPVDRPVDNPVSRETVKAIPLPLVYA